MKTLDEIENERLFREQRLPFPEYCSAIAAEKRRRERKRKPEEDEPLCYNGNTYGSIADIRLAILYDMLRHLMWKTASNQFDINEAAFFESAWERLPMREDVLDAQ